MVERIQANMAILISGLGSVTRGLPSLLLVLIAFLFPWSWLLALLSRRPVYPQSSFTGPRTCL